MDREPLVLDNSWPLTRPIDTARPAHADAMEVTVVRDAARLRDHVTAWEHLSTCALEPNVFYEPWMFLPAAEAFGSGVDFFVLLVYGSGADNGVGGRQLLGFFPLVRSRGYRGVPVRYLTLWEHKYCSICTPLVRADRARECLSALFDWLAANRPHIALVEFRHISGDGPFRRMLDDIVAERGAMTETAETVARAAFRRAADAETYIKSALSSEHRRQLRRKEQRLAEHGELRYTTLAAGGDVEHWLASFVRLESSGWKGRQGSSVGSSAVDREFFATVVRQAFARGRLIAQGLELDGELIAQYCAFTAGDGSFDFKPAYNEEFARYSPGILLELERFRFLHRQAEVAWMDSCSAADSYRNRIWRERRTIHSLLISVGNRKGNLSIAAIRLLRHVKRLLHRRTRQTEENGSKVSSEAPCP